jgi:hypothetical protein
MTRRRLYFICVAVVVALFIAQPATLFAQQSDITVTPTVSYMWGGSVQGFDGDIKLEDGVGYGAIIDVAQGRNVRVELSWTTMATTATFAPYYPSGANSSLVGMNVKVNVHYFQLGAIQTVDKGKAQPFIGVLMGASLFHPEAVQGRPYTTSDVWRFAVSFAGGVNFKMSDRIGLRFQGRLMFPVYFSGAYVGVGTGGASVGATGGIPIVQGDVSAGLSIGI